MADEEHLDILKQGVAAWNQWRKENPDVLPDLREANLDATYLSGVNFSRADFSRADLSEVNLSWADLSRANLIGANLVGANLVRANLREADLTRADLSGADLHEAILIGTILGKASLREAIIHEANLSETHLSGADLTQANLIKANLSWANLSWADLSRADLTEAILYGADLSSATLAKASLVMAGLVDTNLQRADLTGCSVYGTSAWDLDLTGAIQSNLVISGMGEPTITVDDLEVAQFIYLILNRQKLRSVLHTVMQKGVLILGRFGGGGLEVLQSIAAELRKVDYIPIMFDFERPQDRDYTETVKTLAGLSRFVIVDLSGPSVPQELYATVPHYKIPFVPILEKGRQEYSMFTDLLGYPWVLGPPVEFESVEDLIEMLPARIIAPAEEKHQERQALLEQLFNR